jgi:hypothetical protein
MKPKMNNRQTDIEMQSRFKIFRNTEETKRPKIGNYLIGPKINADDTPLSISVSVHLCRKESTNQYFILKILINSNNSGLLLNGKSILHNEYLILSKLKHDKGVIRQHGLFQVLIF